MLALCPCDIALPEGGDYTRVHDATKRAPCDNLLATTHSALCHPPQVNGMHKQYISPQQLLTDAFELAAQVFESEFRPNYIVGVWRGGTPVAIAVHELLTALGIETDHFPISTRSYTGIGQRQDEIMIDGLDYLIGRLTHQQRLLLVDDVHDSGLSLQRVAAKLRETHAILAPDIRIATPYFKPANNRTGREPDYFLHKTDDWLVFPHELDGLTPGEMRDNKPELATVLAKLAGRLGNA